MPAAVRPSRCAEPICEWRVAGDAILAPEIRDWRWPGSIRHAVCMPKPRKVVPIREDQSSIIASDPKARRIILAIGSERIAIDYLSRVTRLGPHTGDQAAAIVPTIKDKKKSKRR